MANRKNKLVGDDIFQITIYRLIFRFNVQIRNLSKRIYFGQKVPDITPIDIDGPGILCNFISGNAEDSEADVAGDLRRADT